MKNSADLDNTLLDLQNSSYPTQPLSIIANYFTRWHKLVWYKNKNIYSVKSLYVQFFTTKSNLEKLKYDYFKFFVFRDTDNTVGDNYFAHFFLNGIFNLRQMVFSV